LNNPKITSRFKNSTALTKEDFKRNMLTLTINYQDLKYTLIEEVIKTELVDLIAGIGVIYF